MVLEGAEEGFARAREPEGRPRKHIRWNGCETVNIIPLPMRLHYSLIGRKGKRKKSLSFNQKKMMFRIRIDDTKQVAATVAAWAETVSRKYVIVHHLVNANSHFHLYLDAPMVMSAQSLRYKVRTKFELDKVQFSVGLCDENRVDEYLSYLFNTKHGNVATLHRTNLDRDVIQRATAAAQVVSEEFRSKRQSNKPKTLYEIAQEVRSSVADDTDAGQIVSMTIRLLHKYCKCHDRYLVIKVVDTVRSMVNPSEYAEYILRVMS